MKILDKITGKEAENTAKTPAKKQAPAVSADAAQTEAKAVATKKAAKPAKENKSAMADKQGVYGVLVSPLITEKSAREEQFGKYTFEVASGATKTAISEAVETRYGVAPVKVNVVNLPGKVKRFGRYWGKQTDTRKAIVTLPKGKTINVYESK